MCAASATTRGRSATAASTPRRRRLRRIAARDGEPIVLLLDDLHWADDGSLDFLDHLAQAIADLPMLMLAPDAAGAVRAPRRLAGHGRAHARIDLRPLDSGASRLLADELLKQLTDVPPALRELVTGGAEGNPFYMEELVKMLVDEGAIDAAASAGRWMPTGCAALACRRRSPACCRRGWTPCRRTRSGRCSRPR